jgi:hypothetical protein
MQAAGVDTWSRRATSAARDSINEPDELLRLYSMCVRLARTSSTVATSTYSTEAVTMGTGNGQTLGHRLRTARERSFVGRATERALFRSALDGDDDAFSVLYLHGLGGVGKTTLLRQLSDDAREAGRVVVNLDARMISPTPSAFEEDASTALDTDGVVLMIDTFEQCQALEAWLRTRFLPRLPYDALVVIAGRTPPDPRWRTDPDWNDALRVITMQGLGDDEAKALMAAKGVPAHLYPDILTFAGGHPLALTLAAEVATRETSELGDWSTTQGVVETLLAQLVGDVPSQDHRRALEVCALVEVTNEEILRSGVGERAGALFEWLRNLPFVESGRYGIFPHDVVRDALVADLRWRDPRGFESLHQRIHQHLLDRVRAADDSAVMAETRSLLYLYRTGSAVADYVTWAGQGEVYEDDYLPEHRDAVLGVAKDGEGSETADLVAFWLDRQPEGFHVHRRTETGEVVAFHTWLNLDEPDPDEIERDPVIAAAWQHSSAYGPSRPGEHIEVSRFAIDPAANGRTSAAVDLMVTRATAQWLRAGRVSWSFMVASDAEFWRPQMDVVDHSPVSMDLRIGGGTYGVFGHDWRVVPVAEWLARMNREVVSGTLPAVARPALILSRPDFDAAVRNALRDIGRDELLTANTLCSTRLASNGAELRRLLTEAVEVLAISPSDQKLYRAVHTTYFLRVPTQEAAAERLGLPFSTFRRHLVAGIASVCDLLWDRELNTK